MQIENLRPIIRGRTRFFIIKCFSLQQIEISREHSVWATTPGPTNKLTKAFRLSDQVILIFSVNESRSIQGFALMESEPDPEYKKEFFKNDELLLAQAQANTQMIQQQTLQFADNFRVRWILSCDYQFKDLEHLPPNPMNDNLPIKQSKNG